jgi:hypothetical protein
MLIIITHIKITYYLSRFKSFTFSSPNVFNLRVDLTPIMVHLTIFILLLIQSKGACLPKYLRTFFQFIVKSSFFWRHAIGTINLGSLDSRLGVGLNLNGTYINVGWNVSSCILVELGSKTIVTTKWHSHLFQIRRGEIWNLQCSLGMPWYLTNTYNHTTLTNNNICSKHLQRKSCQTNGRWIQYFFGKHQLVLVIFA